MARGMASATSSAVAVAVAVLAGLACFHPGAEAISCYDCNSEYDPRCGEQFDPYTLGIIDCNDRPAQDHLSGTNATLCRKLVQKISGKTRVIRKCGYIEDPERDGGCVARSGTHDISVLYCSCKSNLCNAAAGAAPALLALLLAALPALAALAPSTRRQS